MTATLEEQVCAGEREWMALYLEGPRARTPDTVLIAGDEAPDFTFEDHTGASIRLSDFWSGGPALVIFWRHFGCPCGFRRAARLRREYAALVEAGASVVIVGQGEPARAAAYREKFNLPCPILCDPDLDAYDAYGLGDWEAKQVLYAAARLPRGPRMGKMMQRMGRLTGRPVVDHPWLSTGEFVIDTDGTIRFTHRYGHCMDYPSRSDLVAATRDAAEEPAGVGTAPLA
ncbi:MAG TPA: peroxiredoxin-like family protein [Rhodothermales bacterium]|nr:peroxiredoxin-like family protein [Rhodothermales bacterium]